MSSTRTTAVGAAAGAGAYIVGFVVTFLLTASKVTDSALADIVELLTNDAAGWKLVGWVFYNAHFVVTRSTVEVPFLGTSRQAFNLIADSSAFSPGLYAVPVVLLVLAGLVTAYVTDVEGLEGAARSGVAVASGYFVLTVVGAVLVTVAGSNAQAGPDLLTAAVLMGVGYPLVLGTVGAALLR